MGWLSVYTSYGQADDKFVTSHLSVNTSGQEYVEFFQGFEEGMQFVKNGKITSLEELGSHYGVDMKTVSNLDQAAADLRYKKGTDYVSYDFASQLVGIRDNIGTAYTDAGGIRTALRDLAVKGKLSPAEEKALAIIDISMQEVIRNYDAGTNSVKSMHLIKSQSQLHGALPRWLRCVFGVIGGIISGALSGANVGSHIAGAHGAVIGGIIGGIGGGIAAAVNYCQVLVAAPDRIWV